MPEYHQHGVEVTALHWGWDDWLGQVVGVSNDSVEKNNKFATGNMI